MSQEATQTKFVARLSGSGTRVFIRVPTSDLPKVQDLAGKPVIVTLTPIL